MSPWRRKIAIALAVFILAAPAALVFAAPALLYGAMVLGEILPNHSRYTDFDEAEILVDVMTQTPYGANAKKTVHYYSLASRKRIRETAPFDPDPMTVYTVPNPSEIYKHHILEETETKMSFLRMGLTDEAGEYVPVTGELGAILMQLDAIDDWIMTIKIMDVRGVLFVYTELNVNLWTPCTLYRYDPNTRTLTELYTWDNKEPVGLRVRGT